MVGCSSVDSPVSVAAMPCWRAPQARGCLMSLRTQYSDCLKMSREEALSLVEMDAGVRVQVIVHVMLAGLIDASALPDVPAPTLLLY